MSKESQSGFDLVAKWYADGYQATYHRGIIGWAHKRVYRFMEKPHRGEKPSEIIEVGAGSGDYRRNTSPKFSRYVELDLRPTDIAEEDSKVEKVVGDAQDLSAFRDNEFDRLIATCVLIHLDSPLTALREWRRVVRPGGSLSIYVPPEAGLLVRLARKLVTWRSPLAAGLDARRIASLQHKFSYFYLDAIIREVFSRDVLVRRTFPVRLMEFDMALFHVFEIRKLELGGES